MAEAIHEVLAALPMPVLAIGGSERIVSANDAAKALLGQGVSGRHYVTFLRQPQLIETIAAVLQDSQPRVSQYFSSDGIEDTTFRVTVGVLANMRVVLLSFQDVSHLEQADQMRRDFVANVSHELRTPLTALMGFIETLRGPAREDAAARDRFLDIMEGEAGRMNRLVGDLLSLSRVEGNQRVRPQDRVNLSDVVQSVARTLAPLANDTSVVLECDLPQQPVILIGDADQLMQVITNLVENAVKYGGSGGRVAIKLTEVARDTSLRAPGVLISVTDFGPGIDPVHLPRLTERFYRADSHRSRALGGTGLGLAIVKHIINRHRGRLRIDSELGQGSTFTVVLPLDLNSA
ncbi:two-component sensor histidine kinase [Roseobacter denitrificans]|uniref:histidine kinase n=1 Tax=Roseobacter denitrificans (strain ATCC 33942 / OCh 114) TaxID=375451 RepID=Q166A4_ROSDO|nr:ATP-binding protein [Roseobacter denitrificans]ABG32189.1 phosphate regulon sensor protein, putative [Roseobacter denitrificans OCh 114]AVL51685.1 two-component sensor histidine kinase [Roseobacter denitrificans]SFF78443.1 two-component system, OmpR family, phosphate regulon sensor histidine kinase PhoR [Roseobacter denitrificans OCh 114]